MSFFQRILSCFLYYMMFKTSNSEVLRLPCRRHGNFSIRHKDKYLTGVVVLYTPSVLTSQDCVLRCVGHDTCQHVNYNGLHCELLNAGEGKLVNKTGNEYLATEKDISNHGPFCKSLAPCPAVEDCFDICDGLGYRWEDISSVISKDKILKTLSFLSEQWALSFDVLILGFTVDWANIVQGTMGQDLERNPSVYISNVGTLHIHFEISGNIYYYYPHPTPLSLNKFTNIRIQQSLIEGSHLFEIYIDGVKVHEVVNTMPRVFNDVKLYGSNPWFLAANGAVKNLIFGV